MIHVTKIFPQGFQKKSPLRLVTGSSSPYGVVVGEENLCLSHGPERKYGAREGSPISWVGSTEALIGGMPATAVSS